MSRIFNITGDVEEDVTILEKAVVGLIVFDVFLGLFLCITTYFACRNFLAGRRRRAEIPIAELNSINDIGPLSVGKAQPACRT